MDPFADRPFPHLAGRRLTGEALTVPGDLDGTPRLLRVAFDGRSRVALDSWRHALDELARATPTLSSVDVVVLPREYRAVDAHVLARLRALVPDAADHPRTVVAYTDVPRLRALLDADGDALLCVLDDDGHLRWRADGPADDASARALATAVDGLAVPR